MLGLITQSATLHFVLALFLLSAGASADPCVKANLDTLLQDATAAAPSRTLKELLQLPQLGGEYQARPWIRRLSDLQQQLKRGAVRYEGLPEKEVREQIRSFLQRVAEKVRAAEAESSLSPAQARLRRGRLYAELRESPELRAAASWLLAEKLRSPSVEAALFGRTANQGVEALLAFREHPERLFPDLGPDLEPLWSEMRRRIPDAAQLRADPELFAPFWWRDAYVGALERLNRQPGLQPPRYSGHVTQPVPGLYESVPSESPLKAGTLEIRTVQSEHLFKSEIRSANDRKLGTFTRRIDGDSMVFQGASLHGDDPGPSFLEVPGVVPLVPEKGVPTQALITLHQMRRAGLRFGALRSAETNPISNARTILELLDSSPVRTWLEKNPGRSVPTQVIALAIRDTHSVRYMETALTQSGHRIVGIEVLGTESRPLSEVVGRAGNPLPASLLPALVERRLPDGTAVPFSPDQPVPSGFRIRFRLEPWAK